MTKKELRQRILGLRKNMPASEVKYKSELICSAILSIEEVIQSENVCLYVPIRNEVDVLRLEGELRNINKKLFLPNV